MGTIDKFEDMEIWQISHSLVLDIYRLTASFPDNEKFGLISQMRRASVSVPANIAEGFKRRSLKDKIHFYNMAQTSLEEVRYYFLLAKDLGFIRDTSAQDHKTVQIAKMFTSLIHNLEKKL